MRLIAASFAVLLAATTFSTPAPAADWRSVAVVGGERVEIDKSRIMRIASGKTVAWTRLILDHETTDASGSYTAVQAMNRYDCANHSFATLKRVYMGGAAYDRAVREEAVGAPKEISAGDGGVDGKLLAEACRLRTVGEAARVAEQVAQVAAKLATQTTQARDGKPGVMYADVRTAGEAPRTHTVPVADATKPVLKAEAQPEAKVETRPLVERPRFIELPKIDKSQLESPQAPTKEPEPKAAESRTVAKPAATVAKTAEKPVIKIAPPIPPPTPAMAPAVSRQELERIYATSGPRRAPVVARKKPVEEPSPAVIQHREINWGYEGEGSPANWGKLRSDFSTCSTGRRQSPIDIREGIRVDLEPIQFNYQRSQFRIVDNGHTIQVTVGEGSTMTVMNRTYQLLRFHFHRPSEERINGRTFDMVIHLEHKDDEGKIAEVAVLLEKGAENPLIQKLWNNMPLEVNQDVSPAIDIDLNGLLPENRGYYTYMGSLTTPPCTEDVLWMVFKQPLSVSAEQVSIFTRLYKHNARPIQPTNNRLVKENR